MSATTFNDNPVFGEFEHDKETKHYEGWYANLAEDSGQWGLICEGPNRNDVVGTLRRFKHAQPEVRRKDIQITSRKHNDGFRGFARVVNNA